MMDRRRRVLRRDPSPLVQQPFSEYRGLNGLLGLCVSLRWVEDALSDRERGLFFKRRSLEEAISPISS